ncbi:MAG: hypothetical protein ACKVS9_07850 [Phycisphaerae bacterium]
MKSFQVGDRIIIVLVDRGDRIVLADYHAQSIIRVVKVHNHSPSAFDLSTDGAILAVGDDRRRGVSLWSVADGSLVGVHGKKHVARVALDKTCRYAVTWDLYTAKQVIPLGPGERHSLRKLGDLVGALVLDSNEMILPIDDLPFYYKVSFDGPEIRRLPLPHESFAFSFRKSPIRDQVITIYFSGRIECRAGVLGELIWTRETSEDKGPATGCYSPDGRFFAMNVVEMMQYWILDATTGEVTFRSNPPDERLNPVSPLEGSLILASNGAILDASTGEVGPGLSERSWWKAAGL